MKRSLFFLTTLVAGALPLLLADDLREREKERERDQPRREVREKQERMHRESREIHEAVKAGKISHEEGRQKLEVIQRRHHEHEKEIHWKRVKDEIEEAVRSSRMTRKQADAEYDRSKRTQKQKEEVARELHREIEEEMRDLRIAVREGEISEEDARREGSNVKCFSIHVAPIATAAIQTSVPNVWSLYPNSVLNLFPIVCIALRFTSFIGVG